MKQLTVLLVLAVALACLVAASSPQPAVVRQGSIVKRRVRRRNCSQSVNQGNGANGNEVKIGKGSSNEETSSEVDSNSIITPEDMGFTNNTDTQTYTRDPTKADPKDAGVTFNGSIGQYNVANDACLSKSTDTDLVAALNKDQYEELKDKNGNPIRCYECIMIHGDKGDVEVTIVDECPQCENGMINLSPAAFTMATTQAQTATVTWEFAVCSANSFSKTRPDKA
ncbi:hypothetical protein LPJ55_002213 [Coemansia sp. RSA 990]|nr:hypothetical protein LPJ79_000603 [Coemansia sp. RSA 1821]KAJ1873552.1 hypothetical protein LPJ55_002213 [Coemansia sp. RSA 990]